MTMLSRLLVGTAALLLLSLFLLPLWQVRLVAPQYPEGLGMHIHINTVVGATETDLDNINNLNGSAFAGFVSFGGFKLPCKKIKQGFKIFHISISGDVVCVV